MQNRGGSSDRPMIVRYQATTLMKFQVLPNSFRFAAMWAKNVLLPTPAISQISAALLSEFSYKILVFPNFRDQF
jgi:hypothetical protein